MIKHVELIDSLGYTLRGYLDQPNNAKKLVVFFHGYTGNITEHNMHFKEFSRLLSQNGIASLRLSYMGNGESDGEFYNFNLMNAYSDGKDILDYAFSLGFDDVYLLGFSLGGMLASSLCNYRNISKLILWSAASNNSPNWVIVGKDGERIDDKFYFSGFLQDKNFSDGIRLFNCFDEAYKFNGEALICYGENDNTVNPETSKEYAKIFKNATLVNIINADHGYEKFVEQKQLFDVTLNFIEK